MLQTISSGVRWQANTDCHLVVFNMMEREASDEVWTQLEIGVAQSVIVCGK